MILVRFFKNYTMYIYTALIILKNRKDENH